MKHCANQHDRACPEKRFSSRGCVVTSPAFLRAGRIMLRVMSRFTNGLQLGGWERWLEVIEAEKQAGAIMQRCLQRIENGAFVGAWEKWLSVIEQAEGAGAVMQGCLTRIENAYTVGAFDKWVEVVQWDTQAAIDERQASAMRELDEVKGRLEREKKEKAGRKL